MIGRRFLCLSICEWKIKKDANDFTLKMKKATRGCYNKDDDIQGGSEHET